MDVSFLGRFVPILARYMHEFKIAYKHRRRLHRGSGKLPRYPRNNRGKSISLPRYYFAPICNQMLILSVDNKLHNCFFAYVVLMIVCHNANCYLSTISALLTSFFTQHNVVAKMA